MRYALSISTLAFAVALGLAPAAYAGSFEDALSAAYTNNPPCGAMRGFGAAAVAPSAVAAGTTINAGGGVNIVFPVRRGVREPFCDTVLLRSEAIEDLQHDGKVLESEVLGIITHRTNLPFSWRHVSPVKVDQAILHGRIAAMLEQTKGSQYAEEMAVYAELLKEADKNVQSAEADLKQLRADYEAKEEEVRDLKEEIFNLNQTLSSLQADDGQGAAMEVLAPVREQLLDAVKSKLTLQKVVDLMGTLFPDRLVFLDTAMASAKEADRNGSKLAEKACELLHTLATGYWGALNDGKGEPSQSNAVSHGCPPARFRKISILNTNARRRA